MSMDAAPTWGCSSSADVLVLGDGAALVGVLPPVHFWPSEGDRQQALRHGDRLSLPRLAFLERRDVLNWQQPAPQSRSEAIRYRLLNPQAQESPITDAVLVHPWLYRAVALDDSGMTVETSELVADPQAPSGWRPQRIGLQHYRGIRQLPLIW